MHDTVIKGGWSSVAYVDREGKQGKFAVEQKCNTLTQKNTLTLLIWSPLSCIKFDLRSEIKSLVSTIYLLKRVYLIINHYGSFLDKLQVDIPI